MARISYRAPADIDDPQCRAWLEGAMEAGKPGPEFQSIRSHVPGVMRSTSAAVFGSSETSD